jgi:hypothetical protein
VRHSVLYLFFGTLITRRDVIEIEGADKPAMVAETLTLVLK